MSTVQQVDIVRRTRLKELGQLRPGDTNAATIYSPGSNIVARIVSIFVCETSGTARTFRIFLDKDGTTYDQTTALFYDSAVAANSTVQIEGGIFMENPAGNLAVRSSNASSLTFTVYGEEIT